MIQLFTVRKNLSSVWALSHVRSARRGVLRLFNVFLKSKCNGHFVRFDNDVWTNDFQEGSTLLVCYAPLEYGAMVGFDWFSAAIKVTAKTVMESLNGWQMGHINAGRNVVANMVRFAGNLLPEDVDVPLTVKNASHIVYVHSDLQVGKGMVANSENPRCPAPVVGAEGQPRAKQATYQLLGVCNEQVPPTEVKICSELHRNMQRLVETANPAIDILCNYRYVNAGNRLQHEVPPLASSLEAKYGAIGSRQVRDKPGRWSHFSLSETGPLRSSKDAGGMLANSENTPSRIYAEGQPRAKQAGRSPPGVCREHVPTPEGKMCSELHRNMERLAEMISPAPKGLVTKLMVRLIGWAGNMTLSNAFLQGVLTS